MDDDWDLNAVVRGYCATAQPLSNAPHQHSGVSCFQDPVEVKTESPSLLVQDLHDICKPYFPNSNSQEPISQIHFSPQNFPISKSPLPDLQIHLCQKHPPFSVSNGSNSGGTSSHNNPTPRSKRRKNHLKKVCHVAAENLSSDMWSWRKYGQKPIKGSPYPRGYYRCSTSKGCMARKQVERNRSDPSMFIVTYTSEHNHPMPTHRNSLAGSTRQKPDEQAKPSPEKLESSREELPEIEDEEGDDISVTNMAMDDDFFAGLEDYDCVSGHFPESVQFPWLSNSVTTTTAGGG